MSGLKFGQYGIPEGATSDHTKLSNRDKPDQHPIKSISNLEQELNNLLQLINGVKFKGYVETIQELPNNPLIGDTYIVFEDNGIYVYVNDIDKWIKVGGIGSELEIYDSVTEISDNANRLIFLGNVELIKDGKHVSIKYLNDKKSIFNSNTNPTDFDDSNRGFEIGSRWINIIDKKEFICVNNNANSAIWVETTNPESNRIVKQVTKLNVEATSENPHIVEIPIEFTSKFDKLPIEVLRMEGVEGQITQTLAEFDNGDETDFEPNEFVEFDGTMHLKTNYTFDTDVVDENEGIYSFDLSKLNDFKKIINIECR